MRTLTLFNAVIGKESDGPPFVSWEGYVIEPAALWAKDRIIAFYKKEALAGNELNKTFHKSWEKIRCSTRAELAVQQILHYLSTYGTHFQGEIYIPAEVVNVPNTKIIFKVIKGYTVHQMRDKCLALLQSGMALKEETVDDLLSILVEDVRYTFTGKEGIRNKEAMIKIADLYNVLPADTLSFLRYILYRATGSALVIKSHDATAAIESSSYNPSVQFNTFGLVKLAEVFNRFKPLFLAFKGKCPKTINKISKLSKRYHRPTIENALNVATQRELTEADRLWLDHATPYAIFKALSACWTRMIGQTAFVYRIRNGKSWTTENIPTNLNKKNYQMLLDYLTQHYSLAGRKIYIPNDIMYTLPTTEKSYVGPIPTGSKFYGDRLAVGIYWKTAWGADDLDLSGQSMAGKVGWNASYGQGAGVHGGELMYSGDITSAPHGAVEYLYGNTTLRHVVLVKMNVYRGEESCGYKIIIGRGDDIDRQYMMNPNNLFLETKCHAVQRQMILGLLIPEHDKKSFVLLNFGAGHTRVSGPSEIGTIARMALVQQWTHPISFNYIVKTLGADLVDNPSDAEIDLSLSHLEKDSFIRLFERR